MSVPLPSEWLISTMNRNAPRGPERRTVKPDCRYFIGDRPCTFHKAEGVTCGDCDHYSPVKMRILVIKLGAMGDVLRTTSILPALDRKYRGPHITWVTEDESLDLLKDNPMVDSLMGLGTGSLARIQVEAFDLVINPEAARESAALASVVRAKEKKGFGLSPKGSVFPFNPEAEEIFHMGLMDDLKRSNEKTYEELLCRLSGLPYERIPPILRLTDDEIRFAEEFRSTTGIETDRPVVGINTGGGGRWPLKRWTIDGFAELARRLLRDPGTQVLILGGPAEAEINRQILSRLGGEAVDGGCFNPPMRFAGLVNLCDVVVTGDSLALHVGLALRRRVVALFGPTSEAEVDLYGLGTKISAPMDCLCCYRQECDKSPNCMESIPVDRVYRAVQEQLGFLETESHESLCDDPDIQRKQQH
ncbi:MAG: glycosyltransferase family 9 protein [Deltaproteobacteria bacterium]|nr:glycosyltransferase family 9 protein [Deltaproteobacteria bacterium]MBW2121195.1 glycosyltransferase family 9 protein [Deltaproteobacteria bacterium]